MNMDRWLWWLQVALIASAPLLLAVGVLEVMFGEQVTRYEYVYEDGTRVEVLEHDDPFERWTTFIVMSITSLWQLGMGAALFCLRRIGLRLASDADMGEPGEDDE